jgi:hypothetical protein
MKPTPPTLTVLTPYTRERSLSLFPTRGGAHCPYSLHSLSLFPTRDTREQEVKMRIEPEKRRMKDAALAMRKQRAPLAVLDEYLGGPSF